MDNTSYQVKGFTLIELLIVLAVASLLIGAAVPSFTSTIQNNRLSTEVNGLHASLSLARSEAIKRNNNVTVCRSSDSATCTGAWTNGWIVFEDFNFDGSVDVGDEIIRVSGAMPANISVVFSQTKVTYASNGLARTGSNGAFTLCDNRGAASAKGLVISPSGRPRLPLDSNNNGILENGSNVDLTCS